MRRIEVLKMTKDLTKSEIKIGILCGVAGILGFIVGYLIVVL